MKRQVLIQVSMYMIHPAGMGAKTLNVNWLCGARARSFAGSSGKNLMVWLCQVHTVADIFYFPVHPYQNSYAGKVSKSDQPRIGTSRQPNNSHDTTRVLEPRNGEMPSHPEMLSQPPNFSDVGVPDEILLSEAKDK